MTAAPSFTSKENVIDAAYRLKVTLARVQPPTWRRLLVPEDFTLSQLHGLIQLAMGWTDSHLHEFGQTQPGGRRSFLHPDLLEEMGRPGDEDETTTLVREVLRAPRDRLAYVYDFGDHWVHEVVLEKVDRAPDGITLPICLAGRGDCPAEDSGGPLGGRDPEEFDDEEEDADAPVPFDLDAVNRTIAAADWSDPRGPHDG